MSVPVLRPELPELPTRIAGLPVEQRGYPVPWFVVWLDENGDPVPAGEGKPDFRVIKPNAVREAILNDRCWICGGTMGRYRTFVIGPMCAVNRVSAEPPSHTDCAIFAAQACPFLARPHARRREHGLPEEVLDAPGIALKRNPGVALVWTTTRRLIRVNRVSNGILFSIGEPSHVYWFAHGRPATREEVLESINSGLPTLRELADQDGPAGHEALDDAVEKAMELVPA